MKLESVFTTASNLELRQRAIDEGYFVQNRETWLTVWRTWGDWATRILIVGHLNEQLEHDQHTR